MASNANLSDKNTQSVIKIKKSFINNRNAYWTIILTLYL